MMSERETKGQSTTLNLEHAQGGVNSEDKISLREQKLLNLIARIIVEASFREYQKIKSERKRVSETIRP